MAVVGAICISNKKGIVKRPVEKAVFQADFGINGDAHAGKWHRQVSLLAGESIDIVKLQLPTLKDGAVVVNWNKNVILRFGQSAMSDPGTLVSCRFRKLILFPGACVLLDKSKFLFYLYIYYKGIIFRVMLPRR